MLLNKQVTFSSFAESRRYWFADPFLFEWQGQAYLFYERYDRWKCKGSIAYSCLRGNQVSEPKIVLEASGHFSFPSLFSRGDNIFLIPETGAEGEVALYRAKSFPDTWVKEKILLDDFFGTDNVVVRHGGCDWLLSTKPVKGDIARQQLYIFSLNAEFDLEAHCHNPHSDGSEPVRAAGAFLELGEKLLRPVQDGDAGYGQRITLRQVNVLDRNNYLEEDWASLEPSDIRLVDAKEEAGHIGLHTYNQSDHYEVVDLKKQRCFPPIWAAANLFHLVYRYWVRIYRKRI